MFIRTARLARRLVCTASNADPYAVLGVSRSARQSEIRERYLELAKQHHPDSATVEKKAAQKTPQFSLISAAYSALSDPGKRAQTDDMLRRRDPETIASEASEEAILRCRAGRIAEGLSLLVAVLKDDQLPTAHRQYVKACSDALDLCAQRGEPHHAACVKLYDRLKEWDALDATASNAYFQIALRGGFMGLAMKAAKHAEESGLQMSNHMKSTLRQVRRYKKSVGDGSGGAAST